MANEHRFEFRFCLHEKVISRRLEISSGAEEYDILAVSSATSITCTLIALLIKRRNFQAKQNQFFIKRMFLLKE